MGFLVGGAPVTRSLACLCLWEIIAFDGDTRQPTDVPYKSKWSYWCIQSCTVTLIKWFINLFFSSWCVTHNCSYNFTVLADQLTKQVRVHKDFPFVSAGATYIVQTKPAYSTSAEPFHLCLFETAWQEFHCKILHNKNFAWIDFIRGFLSCSVLVYRP